MNDALSLGALLPIGIYMGHNIMAHFLFSRLCHLIIDIVLIGFQLVNLLLGNGKPQFFFRLRKGYP